MTIHVTTTSQTAAAMNDSNDKDKESSPPPRRCTDHQFDTSSNGMESSSDTNDESKDSPAYKSDKLFDFSAAGIDRLGVFDDAAAMDTVDELTMGPPGPLSSLKNEEETTSSGDSPPEKEAQPSRDSPGTKSIGSSNSMDMWQTRFEELQEYKQVHGDFSVPQKYGPLGVWVNKQRNEYNKFEKGMKSQLTHERISQLNSINFTRAKAYGQDLWELRFNELKEYKEQVSRHDLAHT